MKRVFRRDQAGDDSGSPATSGIAIEPRWPVFLAMLAAAGCAFAMPESLSFGPRWLLLVIIVVVSPPALVAHRRGYHSLGSLLGHLLSVAITLFMFFSLFLLIRAIMAHREGPGPLLRSGALLWITNVLVFASWYWRLDAGGPHRRAARAGHRRGAFQFPQMALPESDSREADGRPWSPRFVDYLFLAFNTSTAFSPTDSPVLSRWAKALMMLQSLISLSVTLILVGRAVNII